MCRHDVGQQLAVGAGSTAVAVKVGAGGTAEDAENNVLAFFGPGKPSVLMRSW